MNSKIDQSAFECLGRREYILKGYLLGQLAVIANFSIYYSLFSPVAIAIAGVGGMGQGRSIYSGAVALFQPVAGVLVERIAVRDILVWTFLLRFLIWGGILPAGFIWLGESFSFLILFLSLMLIDGAVVSIGSLVDIDEGGIDLLGKQYDFPVDDELRNKYNSIYEGFTSIGRIVMGPLMAALGVFVANALGSAAVSLVLIMALGFLVPATVGCFFYLKHIPAKAALSKRDKQKLILSDVREIYDSLLSGSKLAWEVKRVRWRIVLNSVDRAIEDSMLLIVLTTFALKILAPGDLTRGALYSALLIAVGKLGSACAAWGMHKYWKSPRVGESQWSSYKIFFPLAFAGTLATILIPVAVAVAISGYPDVAAVLAGVSAVVFNLFFTASVLGFRNLMQGIVSETGASGRLFGIQGMFMMGGSALAIFIFSIVFEYVTPLYAFVITSALYVLYGCLQLLLGKQLLFANEV